MQEIIERYEKVKIQLPPNVKLIAVSKRQPDTKLQTLYDYGHRVFGENIVQELVRKHDLFPQDIEWHMIGHLQRNKVKYITPFISMIHSLDNFELAKEINKRAQKINRTVDCLIEVHVAKEESKFGIKPENVLEILEQDDWKNNFPNIHFRGLMTMATNTDDINLIRKEFSKVRLLFEELKRTYFKDYEYFTELSMGMSNDYKIAVEEGTTMVRIGTLIFGKRLDK